MSGDKVIALRDVSLTYRSGWGRKRRQTLAVDGVSLTVQAGECLGLVGGSGSGKSTLAQIMTGQLAASAGEVRLWLREPGDAPRRAVVAPHPRDVAGHVGLVFQDPFSSFDPLWSLRRSIEEALMLKYGASTDPLGRGAHDFLGLVGLNPSFAARRPGGLSGGQVQRAAIARAIAINPDLLVLDEALSSLDVSVQANVLGLLARLRRELDLTIVFIGHNLAVVGAIADRVAVMASGQLVEIGPAAELYRSPRSEYTRQLIAAVPRLPGREPRPAVAGGASGC
ncbi:ATP-binding cassette domain-containing protein [Acidihalobacter prosperus]|uniref:Oligopeptide transport ATP-binding protein OppF n=1 Tax=Acidihalobacter prosperus TaxID=160660 RepID=A0A1A6C8W4_9GAMM|nr:ATP-binding cassette domain-containing protein [Acidihalobacter prosperus]OBS11007.1 Oligopeptide transport ATP-binding protein OppF [Acidihalobacter prosperus]